VAKSNRHFQSSVIKQPRGLHRSTLDRNIATLAFTAIWTANLLRGRFWGFSPRRSDTLHRWGWNLARRCHDKVIGPQNWIFYWYLTKIWNINAPYPMRDFHKICRICTSFQNALAVKGYGVMGVLIWWGLVTPKFSVPPSGKTMRPTPKRFGGARTCSRSSITMPSLVGLGFHPPPG